MGSLQCGIRRTGRIRLTDDGRLEMFQDRQDGKDNVKIGEMVIGIDGLYIDGVEPIFCQRNDPAKLRLASRYDDDGDGMNGVFSFNRLRDDDRMEERVMVQGGPLSEPNPNARDAGELRIAVRGIGDQQDWKTAFVATSAYLGRLWTGAANWLGWAGKFANPGDEPAAAGGGGAAAGVSRFASDDGRYVFNVQGDPTAEYPHGRIVQYEAATMKAVAILRPEPL